MTLGGEKVLIGNGEVFQCGWMDLTNMIVFRFLGHCRSGALPVDARVLLPPGSRLHPRLRRHEEDDVQGWNDLSRNL